jgi:hypothetical protein
MTLEHMMMILRHGLIIALTWIILIMALMLLALRSCCLSHLGKGLPGTCPPRQGLRTWLMMLMSHGPIMLYGLIMMSCRLRMSSSMEHSVHSIILILLRLMQLGLMPLGLMPLGLMLLRLMLILGAARRVVSLAPRSALPTAAYSTAAIIHALNTRKAYLIPILIYWFQLVSLMQLYPSFPCTPYPGSVSRGCRSTMCCFVSVLRFQFFNIIIHYCVSQFLVHFNIG